MWETRIKHPPGQTADGNYYVDPVRHIRNLIAFQGKNKNPLELPIILYLDAGWKRGTSLSNATAGFQYITD